MLEINLQTITKNAVIKEFANNEFVTYLQQINTEELDAAVFELEQQISPKIDCTQCGNCCNSLMINVEEDEANIAAAHLQVSRATFDENYIEKSMSGKMLISKIPCHFLNDNKCTIYPSRFGGCREFPALHLPKIQKRLFTIFMHYSRCPIIYNVFEELKLKVGFV